ncbi:MAG: alpha/beta hydrolase, partial [Patescibacteria group bacterium]
QEPFWLCGHSLGGICTALYAENYPERVRALAPISTVISGKLSMESDNYKSIAAEWERTGWRITESKTKSGLTKKLKWSHMEDRLRYDLLSEANRLIMPVLMIVGEQDNSTLPEHQKILFDILPGRKALHIIKGAPHTFRAAEHLAEIKSILGKWIDSVLELD